jgi:hypothetical protein
MDKETKEVLVVVLDMLKKEAEYLHRQHGWMISLADAVRQNPEAKKALEQHPFYDQGPRSDERITQTTIRNIDALIQRLKAEN